jgi:hypothetical protein
MWILKKKKSSKRQYCARGVHYLSEIEHEEEYWFVYDYEPHNSYAARYNGLLNHQSLLP